MNAAERDLRRLLAPAIRAGYTLERGKRGHWRLLRPAGTLAVIISGSPSCSRQVQNVRRDLRRAGVPL